MPSPESRLYPLILHVSRALDHHGCKFAKLIDSQQVFPTEWQAGKQLQVAEPLTRPDALHSPMTHLSYLALVPDNNRVLKFNTPLAGDTTADKVFGQGTRFDTNSCKSPSPNSVCGPEMVAVDAGNNLYVVDTDNFRVLQFLAP